MLCCAHIPTRAFRRAQQGTVYQDRSLGAGPPKAVTQIAKREPFFSPKSKSCFTPAFTKENLKLDLCLRAMATATHVKVSTDDTGILGLRQNADSAKKVSETLQADLERYHIFFNAKGFHSMCGSLNLQLNFSPESCPLVKIDMQAPQVTLSIVIFSCQRQNESMGRLGDTPPVYIPWS